MASEQNATALFERATAAGGQLLQVQRLGESGVEGQAAAFALTFDVGRILVGVEPGAERVVAEEVVRSEDLPRELANAMEEEPWWRLLGTRLAGVALDPSGVRLELAFQISSERSRRLELSVEGGGIRAALRD